MIFDTCTLKGRDIDPLKTDADKSFLYCCQHHSVPDFGVMRAGTCSHPGTSRLSELSSQAHGDGNCLFEDSGLHVRHVQIRLRDGVAAGRSVIVNFSSPMELSFTRHGLSLSCWVSSALNDSPYPAQMPILPATLSHLYSLSPALKTHSSHRCCCFVSLTQGFSV